MKESENNFLGIKWTEDLSSGIIWIDRQHKKMFSKINKFLNDIEKGKGAVEAGSTLKFLEDYVKAHFSTESKYMLQYNYPHYKLHMAQHGKYVKEFNELKNKYIREGPSPKFIEQIQICVIDWWINHIENFDKDFGEFLNKAKLHE